MISLKEFKECFAGAPVLVPDYAIEQIYENLVPLLERKQASAPVREFIATYCAAYKEKYNGVNPLIDGASQGMAKAVVKDFGLEKAVDLVLAYLEMPDAFFAQRRHDLRTFKMNIQAINVYLQKGQVMTQTQVKQLDKKITNANAFGHLLGRDKK